MNLRLRLPSPIDVALTVLIAGGLFLLFFHPAILDVRNVGWLLRGSDNGENALGMHAWLADPARHGLTTGLLNAPDGVTLLFTDSNPLIGLIVLPVARAVGGDLQFLGPWYLLCLVLHVAFARALLAPFAPNRVTLWAGVALMTLLPTLYVREIHANLFAHWIILWALWIFVEPRRARGWRLWLAVLGLTALVHSYLLVMVLAIWGSALLEDFVIARAAGDEGVARRRVRVVASGVAGLALVAAIMALMIDRGGLVSSGTFGRFGMPIDAPWNPGIGMMSTLMPIIPQAIDRQLEASQYLGAGLLLLIVAAPFIAGRTAKIEAITGLHRRLKWLIPALVVLTLVAVSKRVDFAGHTLFTLPMSPKMMALIDPVRASSRLFWPVAYVLVLVGVTMADRLSARRATLLLGAAVILQLIDTAGLGAYSRQQNAIAASGVKYARTRDPRWAGAIAGARDVTFIPAKATDDLALYQEVAWRAVDARRSIRLVYAARTSQATEARLASEARAFDAGQLDPHRLYVLLPQAKVPAGAAGRLAVLDGVRVLLPLTT